MHSLKIEFHPIYTKFNDFFSPENVKRNLTNNSLNCISFPKKEEKMDKIIQFLSRSNNLVEKTCKIINFH